MVTGIESDVRHLPEELKYLLRHDAKILIGTAAVVTFSAGTYYADILRSLALIQGDIHLRLAKEKSESPRPKRLSAKRSLRTVLSECSPGVGSKGLGRAWAESGSIALTLILPLFPMR